MSIIKLNRWDSEQLHYMCDKEDKMDACLYVEWQKIKMQPSSSDETEDGVEHTFDIGEDISEELWEGRHVLSIRVNGKEAEKHTVVITIPKPDEEDNED